MGKKIPVETINQIPNLYKKFNSYKKVADELGISTSTVKKYLTLFEAQGMSDTPKEKKTRTKITPELIEQINCKYQELKNISKVAKELNISSGAVRSHLNEESLKIKDSLNDDRDALFFYIYRLFGQYSEEQPVNPWNIVQMQKFKNQGMPYKGQLLTLKYFFEILHNPIEKSRGSIGIIPYKFSDAELYYKKEAARAREFDLAIQKQLAQDRLEIKFNPSQYINPKKKKTIDLNTLGDD